MYIGVSQYNLSKPDELDEITLSTFQNERRKSFYFEPKLLIMQQVLDFCL